MENKHQSAPDESDRPASQTNDNVTDIWSRIRANLELPRDMTQRTTRSRLAWYTRHQAYLDRVADRATPYIYYIVEQLEQRQMPFDLALLPIVESAYQPFAHSRSRASGIWQFIPSTGRRYGLKQNWWYDGRRDIIAATNAALNYLEKLHKEFNGDWLLALAAYNSGERNVARAIKRNKTAGRPTDFWSLRLPRETRGYVPSLLAVAEVVADPAKYDIALKPIPNRPFFEKVNVGSQIDLATISRLSDLSMDEIYLLNPGFNNWATDPAGPHYVLIPVEKAETFRQRLAELPDEERIKWTMHRIKKGDTLGAIARRYRTDVKTLRQVNNLRSNLIRAGHSLLIPTSQKPLKHYTLSLDARRFRGLKRTGDGDRFIYTVRRGDSLWEISRNYGISIRQLCAWNGISPKSTLYPGKKLTLWIKNDQDSDVVSVAARDVATDKQQLIRYTVKKGDSLWLIARRYGVSVKELLKWNNLNKGKYLQPGQDLDIYIGRPPADA